MAVVRKAMVWTAHVLRDPTGSWMPLGDFLFNWHALTGAAFDASRVGVSTAMEFMDRLADVKLIEIDRTLGRSVRVRLHPDAYDLFLWPTHA